MHVYPRTISSRRRTRPHIVCSLHRHLRTHPPPPYHPPLHHHGHTLLLSCLLLLTGHQPHTSPHSIHTGYDRACPSSFICDNRLDSLTLCCRYSFWCCLVDCWWHTWCGLSECAVGRNKDSNCLQRTSGITFRCTRSIHGPRDGDTLSRRTGEDLGPGVPSKSPTSMFPMDKNGTRAQRYSYISFHASLRPPETQHRNNGPHYHAIISPTTNVVTLFGELEKLMQALLQPQNI